MLGLAWAGAAPLAAEVTISRSIGVSETYTDNVGLDSNEEDPRSSFVTQVSPSVNVTANGRRLDLSLAYRLQQTFRSDSSNATNQQLSANANTEILRNHFFITGTASVFQAATDLNSPVASDNVNRNGNLSTIQTYSVSPNVRGRLGGFAEGDASYTLRTTKTDTSNASDAITYTFAGRLRSGRDFRRLRWSLNYRDVREERTGADDVQNRTVSGSLSKSFSDHWTAFSNAGYSESNTASSTGNDGSFYTAGVTWTPSRRISISADAGHNDRGAEVVWSPSRRTSVLARYRERNVGFNAGPHYTLNVSHRMRRSNFQLEYDEERTTTQRVLAEPRIFLQQDADGNLVFVPVLTASLTDDIFERQRLSGNFSYQLSRTSLGLGLAREDRNFSSGGGSEQSLNATGSVNYRISRRLSANFLVNWRKTEPRDGDRTDELLRLDLSLVASLGQNTRGVVSLAHARNDSTDPLQKYDENRVSLFVNMSF